MNQEIKAQWVAALRSGAYTKTTEGLHDDTGYCCLGVLCDLAAKQGLGRWIGHRFNAAHETNAGAFLHPVVAVWADLAEVSPRIVDLPLTALNDGDEEYENGVRPHTFAEIADLIEQHL